MKTKTAIIKQTKGNIPIQSELLDKYTNVNELINDNINNYNNKICISNKNNILELQKIDSNKLSKMKENDIFKLAKIIFQKYNSKNVFENYGNKIMVSNQDIKESIRKVLTSAKQKQYLLEHLQIYFNLGNIIELSTLSAQALETKKRIDNNLWNYYLNGVNINNKSYLFEFDVISRNDGENHYRVQRLTLLHNKTNASTSSISKTNT